MNAARMAPPGPFPVVSLEARELPLIIIMGSLANRRVDDDLSRHIGLNHEGTGIVEGLFRSSPAHAVVPILTGILFSLAGVIAVVGSLPVLYERLFELEDRGWHALPRAIAWIAVCAGVLIAEGTWDGPLRSAVGLVADRSSPSSS